MYSGELRTTHVNFSLKYGMFISNLVQSVILAGGLGTRLLPYTMFMPKPMLPLGEKPILEHIIEWNIRNGIRDIILCTSYLGRVIKDYFDDGSETGASFKYTMSRKPLSTAGQLKTAQELVHGRFVCEYGDSIYDFDISDMIEIHKRRGAFITMGLHEYDSLIPYGVIDSDGDGNVLAWREKPSTKVNINMGCYVMEPDVLNYIPPDTPWGMDALIDAALKNKETVLAYPTKGKFIDVGTYSLYKEASEEFRKRLGDI